MSEDEIFEFQRLARIRLENMEYKVYYTNAKYIFNGEEKKVEINEVLIAIKK